MHSRPEIAPDTATDLSQLPPGTSMYLAVFDCLGLEYLFNLSAWDRARVWSEITGRPSPIEPPPLTFLLIRAQANLHRRPEIVTFTVDDAELPEETLRELFETEPQTIVDAIRDRCTYHFNGRALVSDAVIR